MLDLRRSLIVVGGSLGGLQALQQLLMGLPSDFPASILVALHSAEGSPKLAAGILSRHTSLTVLYARAGDLIRVGRLRFHRAPRYHLVVRARGVVALDDGPKLHYSRPAVDRLFQSAATEYGSRVAGVVLSGGRP